MSDDGLEVYWYLVPKDGFYPWKPAGARNPDFSYFRQLAGAVDHCGYSGALLATGGGAHDPWLTGAALIPVTEQMKFIIAVHPGIVAPAMLAQKAATFDQFSKGRLIVNVITGQEQQFPQYGIELSHDERYALTDEYWAVWRRIMSGETVDFQGKHVHVRGAKLLLEPYQRPYPPLFFGGSSPVAQQIAAKHVDTYLTWGEPPPMAAEKLASVRAQAATLGRKLRFGLRINVIVRETKQEAWDQAQWFQDRMDHAIVAEVQASNRNTDSVGQQRMNSVLPERLPPRARDLEIYPDIWAGFGMVRNGPGTAIVGDRDTVAARLQEYRDIGFDTFILSNYPLLEEAYRVADLLFPAIGFTGNKNTPTTYNFAAHAQNLRSA
jgi:alkanesulfonate monooxygenase